MKKLYDKNELYFAIGAIVVYVMAAGNVRGNFGDDSLWMVLTLGILSAGIAWFLTKNGLWEKYRVFSIPKAKPYLYFLPFVFFAAVNLLGGIRAHYPMPRQLYAVLSMGLVGFVEEMIFRGFLFRAIEKDSRKQAIIISAVTFGAGHIINLFTGQPSFDTILQVVYAVAIGFSFVLCMDRCGSLLPCIITHSLVDITSKFSAEVSDSRNLITAVVITAVAIGYSVYLLRLPEKKQQ